MLEVVTATGDQLAVLPSSGRRVLVSWRYLGADVPTERVFAARGAACAAGHTAPAELGADIAASAVSTWRTPGAEH